MKRLTTILAAAALGATAAASTGCATLLDSGDYEARPQTQGQSGLPDWKADDQERNNAATH